jgi:hypothetical protein
MNNHQATMRVIRREFRNAEIAMIRDINQQIWGLPLDTRYSEERLFLARDWNNLGPIFPRIAVWERRWRIARLRAHRVMDRVRYR